MTARSLAAATLLLLPVLALGAPPAAPVADDYPRALAEARRLDVPILVDVWAPW